MVRPPVDRPLQVASRSVTMFNDLLRKDREAAGLSIGQAAWRLGVSPTAYREIEAGERWPHWETFHRICELYGGPQTFVMVL